MLVIKPRQDTADPYIMEVEGTPTSIVLFYCMWQTELWPEWVQSTDHNLIRQHNRVLNDIRQSGCVYFSVGEKKLKDAFDVTTQRVQALGIKVTLLPRPTP